MKQSLIAVLLFCFASVKLNAQAAAKTSDSANTGKINVFKDPRLDELVKKEAAFNVVIANSTHAGRGYRLLVLSSNDRNLVMKVRGQLLQHFPDQKVYMTFQPPYIKLKFGNFLEKSDAENYKKQLVKSKVITNNIYTVPDNIEVKPDKNKDKETQ
jgi:hypothetical protein